MLDIHLAAEAVEAKHRALDAYGLGLGEPDVATLAAGEGDLRDVHMWRAVAAVRGHVYESFRVL